MPALTFSLSDEDVERIAERLAEKLTNMMGKPQPQPQRLPADDRLQISRAEAARRLDYDLSSLDRLVKRGLIHPNLATRRPKFPVKELERFIKECSV